MRDRHGTFEFGKVRRTNCRKKSPVGDAFYVRAGCCPGDAPKRSAGPTWVKSRVQESNRTWRFEDGVYIQSKLIGQKFIRFFEGREHEAPILISEWHPVVSERTPVRCRQIVSTMDARGVQEPHFLSFPCFSNGRGGQGKNLKKIVRGTDRNPRCFQLTDIRLSGPWTCL
jgi:hypothetical protein